MSEVQIGDLGPPHLDGDTIEMAPAFKSPVYMWE